MKPHFSKTKYGYVLKASASLVCAFSARQLDVGFHSVPQKKRAVNRRRFLQNLGINHRGLVCMQQVHGSRIRRVVHRDKGRGAVSFKTALPGCDALVTNEKNIPLAVLTADCLPIFIYDSRNAAVAIVHAGWKSTRRKIVSKTLRAMKRYFKTRPQDVRVFFGPGLRSCCYEVRKEFRRYFPKNVIKRGGKRYFDLIGANKTMLFKAGVKRGNISDSRLCTACKNREFFSYRREGEAAGRMMSVIMLREN